MSAVFRWSLLSGGRKDRFDCNVMSPSESRLLSHVSDTASTCILWEYMKFDNSAILLRIERALKVHMFSSFMFANDLGLQDISLV